MNTNNQNNQNNNNIKNDQQQQQYHQQFDASELERLGRGWKRLNQSSKHRVEALTTNDDEKRNMSRKIQKFRAYDFLLRQEEAKRWIESMLDTKIFFEHHVPSLYSSSSISPSSSSSNNNNKHGRSPSPDLVQQQQQQHVASTDFFDQLRDGVTLCRLASCWMTKDNGLQMKKFHSNVNAKKGGPLEIMVATDNIHTFFQCCRSIEFPSFYDFSVPDLWERKNIWQVVHCIHALAHFLDKQGLLRSDDESLRIQDLSHAGIEFSVEEMERAEQDFLNMEQMNLKIDYSLLSGSKDGDGDDGEVSPEKLSVHSIFLTGDDDIGDSGKNRVDVGQCTIEGKGAVAGELNKFHIMVRNSKGELVVDSQQQYGGRAFNVRLVNRLDPRIVVQGQCTDLGDGRVEVTYVPTVAGRYTWDIDMISTAEVDNNNGQQQQVQKLTHPSISSTVVRVLPGGVCVRNCVIIDPQQLQVNQTEGETFTFHIQARDQCGNNCINGGYKFSRTDLRYFGNNLNNKPIDSSRFLTVTDMSNGVYQVSGENCLPGTFQLLIGDEHELIPSLDPFLLQVSVAPLSKLHITFENFTPHSGVAQFKVTANDNSPENTRYVSVVCTDSIGAELNDDLKANIENVFRTEFVNWVNMTRKNTFDRLINPTQFQMDEDEIFSQDKSNRIWGALNNISNDYKCSSVKSALNRNKFMPKPVDYVVISDDYVDWSQYDRMLLQQKEEQERMEKEMREQEENRLREQREAEERLLREQQEKWTETSASATVARANDHRSEPVHGATSFVRRQLLGVSLQFDHAVHESEDHI